MRISLVIPVYNEKGNISSLSERIASALQEYDFEVVFIDDASTDGSLEAIREITNKDQRFKAIVFRKNFGQTAAIAAGVDVAQGEIIIPMDADLENEPEDIPKLIAKLEEGYDVVSGWRKDRWQGQSIQRKIPSIVANWLISKVSSLALHDYGCTLKAYRAEVIKNIRLYGDMHRFIPAYAYWNGAKVAELMVNYKPRTYGESKYGISRLWRVMLDLITLKFLSGYATRPSHLFGNVGLSFIFLGLIAGALSLYYKLSTVHHKDFIQTPLPVIMAMLLVVGVMLIMIGLISELLVRTYHESQDKRTYVVKERFNIS